MIELNKQLFIEDLEIVVKEYPLKKTYNLSFASLDKFVSIKVLLIFSDKRQTVAEVVPLLGYNKESQEIILENLTKWSGEIKGMTIESARNRVEQYIKEYPFSTSPLLTAIDLLEFQTDCHDESSLSFVKPTSTSNITEFEDLLLNYNGTIKVKLTGNVEEDVNALKNILIILKNYHKKIRFDANQAYNYKDAVLLFQFITENDLVEKVQYVEQPLAVGNEAEMGKLRAQFEDIEIMLDESIVVIPDLLVAIDNNVNYVKLKLFKQGGIKETLEIAKKAVEYNLKVVFGNGVATYVSNQIENQIYFQNKKLFELPLESNGFLKLIEE